MGSSARADSDLASLINDVASVTTVVALATAEIPGVDLVTGTIAVLADTAAAITNGINFARDLLNPCTSVLQTLTDGLSAALSLAGAGGLARGLTRAAEDVPSLFEPGPWARLDPSPRPGP